MKKKHNQGFSLVELLIAIAILSLIMIALASFMGTTTNSYVRSRNDIELQQTGQEVFDMISDKLMQAKLVRIGTTEAEYAAVGDRDSVKAGVDYALLDESGTPITTSDSRPVYSFDALTASTITDTNQLTYIAILYDQKILDPISMVDSYGHGIDVYFFEAGSISLFHRDHPGYIRVSAVEGDTGIEPEITSTFSYSFEQLCNQKNTISMEDLQNEHWVCDTIKYEEGIQSASIYAIPDENALYLHLDFKKQNMENTAEGMVTIRNSYVLKPKDPPSVSGGSSSSI